MSDLDKLHQLCNKTYKEQAVWFLNCFWDKHENQAETLWSYVLKLNELDIENHDQGSSLDEMKAHVFLEKFDETLTVREMRERLRSTGAIGEAERPKQVPLIHYLLYKYGNDWHTLVDESRQGSNKEELEKAEKMLAEVQAAFKSSEEKASIAKKKLLEAQSAERSAKDREAAAKASEQAAKQREEESKKTAEEAKRTEAQAKERDAEAKAAKQELEAALNEVKAQEDAYNNKKAELERKSEEGGVVSKNKAKAELAQHLAEDPLPLRRAKITQEAAFKKSEKAANAAAEARAAAESSARAAEQAAKEATSARQLAEQDAAAASRAREAATAAAEASAAAKAEADAAVDAALKRLQEAEEFLAEVRSRPGQAFGALWWIDRELHEQKKYLPESKGGIRK